MTSLGEQGFWLVLPGWLAAAFLLTSLVGAIAEWRGWRLPVAGTAYGFCLANAGFLVGVLKAIAGTRIAEYR
jgi:hypothetical protein